MLCCEINDDTCLLHRTNTWRCSVEQNNIDFCRVFLSKLKKLSRDVKLSSSVLNVPETLTTLAYVTALSLHGWIGGVTPGYRRGVRVTTVIIIQTLIRVSAHTNIKLHTHTRCAIWEETEALCTSLADRCVDVETVGPISDTLYRSLCDPPDLCNLLHYTWSRRLTRTDKCITVTL